MPRMLLAAGVAFVLSFACVRIVLARFGQMALDRPNERSLHASPVPRSGGFAVLAGAGAALALGAFELWFVCALAALLAAVSFVDDLYGVPAMGRLTAHLVTAGLTAWYFLSPMNLVELAVIILAMTWITNLYNFMDGSDGLAGGMTVIGFAAYALAADPATAVLCAAIAAAAAAFVLHNFHPARIFLGDVGSIPLGYLAAALGVVGWRNDAWPLWFPLLVFGPFIGDATVTLVRRLIRGERVWRAHREHYYQRMVRMGLGHRGTALAAYAAMIVCAAAALYGRDKGPAEQAMAFFGASALLAAAAVWVDLRWARHQRAAGAAA
jgi:UDP-N-acetylmuramyl pentapeptide phosphotransferase/UDP-N-acetylglucosamine-1-phosphate transferase